VCNFETPSFPNADVMNYDATNQPYSPGSTLLVSCKSGYRLQSGGGVEQNLNCGSTGWQTNNLEDCMAGKALCCCALELTPPYSVGTEYS